MFPTGRKVLTSMVGDLFHVGHLNLLEKASKLGNLIVCIPTSEGAFQAKGRKPVISFEDRLRIVNSLKFVTTTIGFYNNEHLDKIIELIRPDLFVRGDDWPDFPGRTKLSELNIPIEFLPYTKGISSTLIKEKICSEQCEKPKKS